MAIVTITDNVTSIIVNNRYFPNSGTVSDVGGIISTFINGKINYYYLVFDAQCS